MDSGDKSVSLSDTFALGVVHPRVHHHGHPVLDEEGRGFLAKRDNGGPILNFDECTGRHRATTPQSFRNSQLSRAGSERASVPELPSAGQRPTFGRRRYIEVGPDRDLSNLRGGISP
jgi:hypothetical protein